MWALGHIEQLDWPSEMCDVPKLAGLVAPHEDDAAFIRGARLRSASEILDAQDLIMRIHWAIRDACYHGGLIPEDLDWSQDSEWVAVAIKCRRRCGGRTPLHAKLAGQLPRSRKLG